MNIKFIILNNDGYLSIKNTQTKYFQGRVYGTNSETGLWFPNFMNIATAFDIDYYNIQTLSELETLSDILRSDKPGIIDCRCCSDQEILPAQALKEGKQAGLHDMAPFLSDEELNKEMIIKI